MIAACHRRAGNYQQALAVYQAVHRQFPENIDCLKYLTRLCTDMGMESEAISYADELKRLEKSRDRAASSMSIQSRKSLNRSAVRSEARPDRSANNRSGGSREGSASSSGSSGYLTAAASPRSVTNSLIKQNGGKNSAFDDMLTVTPESHMSADLDPLPERPTTSWKRNKGSGSGDMDEFGNEEIDLPE